MISNRRHVKLVVGYPNKKIEFAVSTLLLVYFPFTCSLNVSKIKSCFYRNITICSLFNVCPRHIDVYRWIITRHATFCSVF